ncbi:hypothetical protein JAAARDRAFT_63527 [Jaapia argillacea MUCL 33604]|uniref:F-box domain-containing protein n=1 Tax=Jaapia argillacea MUCL 33604 TaxID=933084 RepID=A0A067PH04_9AGAM|nr:hypothetical protein JAAARDRAFT_63527 [Jaapia argillacea MUCL 33604]
MSRAQDRVFGIAEVCREICWHIHAAGRHDITMVARCSRLLMEPALDVLWNEMLDVEPLLKLIPALEKIEAWDVGDAEYEYDYKFLYPPQTNDWSRFDFYGRRVRTLQYVHEGEIDCTVFHCLGRYRLTPMLPALRTLYWYHYLPELEFGPEFIAEVSPFITPLLRHISIGTSPGGPTDQEPPSDREAMVSFFHMLPYRTPLVEKIEIYGNMHDISFAFISRFQQLRVVNLSGLQLRKPYHERETLTALSTLPLLESVIALDVFGDKLVGISLRPGFPSLTHLSLDRAKPLGALILLKMISSRALKTLSISRMDRGSSEDVISCVAYLSNFSSTLEDICFHSQYEHSSLDVGMPIVEACLQLPRLRTFQLCPMRRQEWPTITQKQAEEMTEAWPRMRDLSLPCHITLHPLKALALRLHSLRSLSFGTLFVGGNVASAWMETPILSHGLLKVSIDRYSPNDKHLLVASILDRLFPRLQVGSCAGDQVIEAISILQAARADQEWRVQPTPRSNAGNGT